MNQRTERGDVRVMGLQSGTSMDGIDVVALDLLAEGEGLLAWEARFDQRAYPEHVRKQLAGVIENGECDAELLCRLDTEIGKAFADAAGSMIERDGPVELVSSMGQTIFHWVDQGMAEGSLQIGQPAWIAERTGVPVVSDFRPRDIAAGGEGAPLAPILDELLVRGLGRTERVAMVNIGGIANITMVGPGEPAEGYDTGPGNALLDAAWQQRGDPAKPFDVDAAVASTGTVHQPTLQELIADPYFTVEPPKSTGKEYFNTSYVDKYPDLSLPDLLRTFTALTALHIVAAAKSYAVTELVLSGGGAANPLLRKDITRLAGPIAVRISDDIGVPFHGKEAVLSALLGWLSWHGLPANMPSVTGADGGRILGRFSPGAGPLRLPEPLAAAPQWLRFS